MNKRLITSILAVLLLSFTAGAESIFRYGVGWYYSVGIASSHSYSYVTRINGARGYRVSSPSDNTEWGSYFKPNVEVWCGVQCGKHLLLSAIAGTEALSLGASWQTGSCDRSGFLLFTEEGTNVGKFVSRNGCGYRIRLADHFTIDSRLFFTYKGSHPEITDELYGVIPQDDIYRNLLNEYEAGFGFRLGF